MGSLALVLGDADPASTAVVQRMLEAAPHRGAPGVPRQLGGATFGVAVADGPPDASVAVDDGLAVVFTGVLDNADALAAELGITGGIPSASVCLAAHRRWGDDAPRHLRGLWALVVTDGRTVWASRDPLGLRSLFFHRGSRGVIVATEAKQVVAGTGRSLEPDLEVVERIVFREYDDDTPSALLGAERVPRGTTIRLGALGTYRRRYWEPKDVLETATFTEAELEERFHELMTQAAGRSLMGDDVISLSGGLDSSTVASYAAPVHLERFGRPLEALSVVYPRFPAVDESSLIELTSGHLGLELHTYEESSKTLDDVDGWMRLLDSPVPQFFLPESAEHYRKARSMGYRTMLTGELAEWIVERRDYLISHLLLTGRWGPMLDHLRRQRRLHGARWRGIAKQIGASFLTPSLERAWTRVRPASVVPPPWVDEARLRRVEARYATAPSERWAGYQVAIFLGPDLSSEADDIAQAVTGMTVRRPFGDQDLVEFFLSLPAEQKFPDTHFKGLMRRMLRGRVPDVLLDSPNKAVFNDAVMARADYDKLRDLLVRPPHRLAGIDYELLAARLEHGDLGIGEYEWAKNLAATHAFLRRW